MTCFVHWKDQAAVGKLPILRNSYASKNGENKIMFSRKTEKE